MATSEEFGRARTHVLGVAGIAALVVGLGVAIGLVNSADVLAVVVGFAGFLLFSACWQLAVWDWGR